MPQAKSGNLSRKTRFIQTIDDLVSRHPLRDVPTAFPIQIFMRSRPMTSFPEYPCWA